MDNTHQEPNLDRIFKAAKRAHDRGKLEDALSLYKLISDKDPYFPGLDTEVRALEMEMTLGTAASHQSQSSVTARQTTRVATTPRPQPVRPSRRPAHHTNPYLLYGSITFLPAIILTFILTVIVFPDWDRILIWLVVINVITFFVYGYDKLISPTGIVRVPESILLLQVLLGAFVGALIVRWKFRHKTQKLSFRVKFWLAAIFSFVWIAGYYIFIWWPNV